MPIYEYECRKCGVFDYEQSVADRPLARCPTCRSKVTKLISASAFHLKGGGWYADGYDRKRLDDDNAGEYRKNHPDMVHQKTEIEEHAYGDEEERGEGVPEGYEFGDDLCAVYGLGDRKTGDEGAESEREPRKGSEPRRAEADEDDRGVELPGQVASFQTWLPFGKSIIHQESQNNKINLAYSDVICNDFGTVDC